MMVRPRAAWLRCRRPCEDIGSSRGRATPRCRRGPPRPSSLRACSPNRSSYNRRLSAGKVPKSRKASPGSHAPAVLTGRRQRPSSFRRAPPAASPWRRRPGPARARRATANCPGYLTGRGREQIGHAGRAAWKSAHRRRGPASSPPRARESPREVSRLHHGPERRRREGETHRSGSNRQVDLARRKPAGDRLLGRLDRRHCPSRCRPPAARRDRVQGPPRLLSRRFIGGIEPSPQDFDCPRDRLEPIVGSGANSAGMAPAPSSVSRSMANCRTAKRGESSCLIHPAISASSALAGAAARRRRRSLPVPRVSAT